MIVYYNAKSRDEADVIRRLAGNGAIAYGYSTTWCVTEVNFSDKSIRVNYDDISKNAKEVDYKTMQEILKNWGNTYSPGKGRHPISAGSSLTVLYSGSGFGTEKVGSQFTVLAIDPAGYFDGPGVLVYGYRNSCYDGYVGVHSFYAEDPLKAKPEEQKSTKESIIAYYNKHGLLYELKEHLYKINGDYLVNSVFNGYRGLLSRREQCYFDRKGHFGQSEVHSSVHILPVEPITTGDTVTLMTLHDFFETAYKRGYIDLDAWEAIRTFPPLQLESLKPSVEQEKTIKPQEPIVFNNKGQLSKLYIYLLTNGYDTSFLNGVGPYGGTEGKFYFDQYGVFGRDPVIGNGAYQRNPQKLETFDGIYATLESFLSKAAGLGYISAGSLNGIQKYFSQHKEPNPIDSASLIKAYNDTVMDVQTISGDISVSPSGLSFQEFVKYQETQYQLGKSGKSESIQNTYITPDIIGVSIQIPKKSKRSFII